MLGRLYVLVSPWATSNEVQRYKNRLLGKVANLLYKPYCAISKIKRKQYTEENVIVTLTTFPGRINQVYYCLHSLLRQSVKPEKVVLWLSKTQFPDLSEDIPKRIIKLKKYGLDIQFCDDYRSYKKIVPSSQLWSDKVLVTADDDTLYPEDWLENLLKTHKQFPENVVCYRAHEITLNDKEVLPYNKWNGLSMDIKGPLMKLLPVGVGGVLYPPYYFSGVEFNYEEIKNLAPTTDDIWLRVVGLTKQIKVVKVFENSKEWFTVKGSQASSLVKHNVEQTNANDTALRNLMEYYGIGIECFKE